MLESVEVYDVALAGVQVLDDAGSAENGIVMQADEMLVAINVVLAKWKFEVFFFGKLFHQVCRQFQHFVNWINTFLRQIVDQHVENLVVQRENLEQSEALDNLRAQRASNALILEEQVKTGGANSVAAVNQNARSLRCQIVVPVANWALLKIQNFPTKLGSSLSFFRSQEAILVQEKLRRIVVELLLFIHSRFIVVSHAIY